MGGGNGKSNFLIFFLNLFIFGCLFAPQHVGSSRTRDRTRVPCTGRQILNHCATREVPQIHVDSYFLLML